MNLFLTTFLAGSLVLLLAALAAGAAAGRLLDHVVDRLLVRLLKDRYDENLWDLVIGVTRMGPHVLFETELRADNKADAFERPLGSLVRTEVLSGVAFNPAQLIRPPLAPDAPVDLSVRLGPRARRPLRLDFPVLVAGMGYGVALNRNVVLALARGASLAGTAYNAGSGPLLEEVARSADRLIVQYSGGAWTRDPKRLEQADMIEIQVGHGGRAAAGRLLPPDAVPAEVRKSMQTGSGPDQPLVVEAPVPGTTGMRELRRLVRNLRQLIDGGPIAVKLAATHDLEVEVLALLEAGVDVIVVDGSEAGTHSSPPVIADDFGIPTAHALARVTKLLDRTGARREVSLIISGGFRTPGEVLKAVALGADAVYMGTAVLMAATHGQLSKSVPVEPVTQIAWAAGRFARRFDPDLGAETVHRFLRSVRGELADGLRALGRPRLRDLTRGDLVARDRVAAEVFELPVSWRPPRNWSTGNETEPGWSRAREPQPPGGRTGGTGGRTAGGR
ncbi:MAG: FMN-binding glutamate synthase family protein [Bacillota bacterium]|nr:FMN-binding glutamate synthase family protein [Bacillota bacterium]